MPVSRMCTTAFFSVTSEYGDVAFFYEDGTMLFDYIWKAIGNFVPAQFDNGVCLMRSKEKVGTQYPLCILYRDGRVKQLPTEYYNGTQFLDGIARLQKENAKRQRVGLHQRGRKGNLSESD